MKSAIELPNGLHARVPDTVYHARVPRLVSKHVLDEVHRSPAHYRAWLETIVEPEPTPAMAFGTAFHCALLEPQRFASTYVVEPDFGDCRRKEPKAQRDAWRAENTGRLALDAGDAECIERMVVAVRAHPLAGRMVKDGEAELTARWTDEETGLSCKARADYFVRARRMIVDVKSTADASADAFKRDVARYRYHVQDAMYRAGFTAAGAEVAHFVLVAVEKEPPHAIGIYSLDEDGVARGYGAVRRDMETLAACLRDDRWPGYPEQIQTLELPPWAA